MFQFWTYILKKSVKVPWSNGLQFFIQAPAKAVYIYMVWLYFIVFAIYNEIININQNQ